MAIVACPDCGNQVSSNAYMCMKCGAPNAGAPLMRTDGRSGKIVVGYLLFCSLLYLLLWMTRH